MYRRFDYWHGRGLKTERGSDEGVAIVLVTDVAIVDALEGILGEMVRARFRETTNEQGCICI